MNSVAIIGGGITGLSAAHRLKELGIPVTVYESSSRVGGVIQTVECDGFLAESGPNTILETSPIIARWIERLGLESERIYSNPKAKHRYLLRHGVPQALPDSAWSFLNSRLLSLRAKLRLPLEVFVPRSNADREENVAAFVTRRLGREFLDYFINPMVGGIYAGDPERLSVQHAFPKLHTVEQRYGSLLLGQILGSRDRERSKEVSKSSAPKFSFKQGLQTLTNALYGQMSDSIQLNTRVEAVRYTGASWEIVCHGQTKPRRHAAALLCAPAYKLAEMTLEGRALRPVPSLGSLGEIRYAPVASLVLGFRRERVAHPLDGFGVLIPEVEGRYLLGVIFSSSLFAGRAPAGHVTLTCYLGGMRSPSHARDDTARAVASALADLRPLLGVEGSPAFVRHVVFEKAIPQYEVGFGRFKQLMDRLEADLPGLCFAGHFRNGISLSDSIIAGDGAANKIHSFLRFASRSNRVQRIFS